MKVPDPEGPCVACGKPMDIEDFNRQEAIAIFDPPSGKWILCCLDCATNDQEAATNKMGEAAAALMVARKGVV